MSRERREPFNTRKGRSDMNRKAILAAVLREITAGILMIRRNGIRIRTDMLTGSDPATIMARPDLPAALEQAQRRQGARKEGLS